MPRKKDILKNLPVDVKVGNYEKPKGVNVAKLTTPQKRELWSKLSDDNKEAITHLTNLRDHFDGELFIEV